MYEKMGRRFRTVSRFVSLEISKFMRFQPGFLFAIFDFNIRVYVRTYVRAVSPRNLSFFSSLFFFSVVWPTFLDEEAARRTTTSIAGGGISYSAVSGRVPELLLKLPATRSLSYTLHR